LAFFGHCFQALKGISKVDQKETEILGDAAAFHWYYKSKAAAIERYVRDITFKKILDVGAGTGVFSRFLLHNTRCEEATCVDIGYSVEKDETEGSKPIRFRREADVGDADLVLLMDVLEHVDDDTQLLASYVAPARQGTRFLMTVPAFSFLWSDHDVFLEHRRRYTLSDLENVARRARLAVERGNYYFAGVFPIAAVIRLLRQFLRADDAEPKSHLKRHSELINLALTGVCHAELPFLRFNRLFGLTALCLARKP
jgi:hypothetical protein